MGRDVRAEQVRTLYGQSLPLLVGNVANGAIVAAVLWATQDHGVISVWFGTVLLVTGARAALWRAFVALAPGTDAVPAWGIRYSIGVALSGAAWGSASLLFLEPDRPLSVALIGFLIGGMGAAAAGTLACYVPAFVAYAVPLLAANARDAMPDGGALAVRTRATFKPASRDAQAVPCVLLEVTDTGSGMQPDVVLHAFDPFFTTKPQGQGAGLGLASVFGIVEQGGGRIEVESSPGRGSRLGVILPLAAELPDAPESRPPSRPPTAAPSRRVTVLVAEDERDVRAVVARVLRRAGHEVITTADGVEAIEAAHAHAEPIDVLVTDVVMARMGGPELARHLRGERPELGVVFMSGHVADDAPPPHDLSHGVVHLDKPFQPQDLVAAVNTLLERAVEHARSS